jgi:adenosylcobyric acid synthase
MIAPGQPIPGDAAWVLLPGTKATIADLGFLRAQGWDVDIAAHVRRGGRVLGICGGYQMLGRTVADPGGIEGEAGTVAGLGLLPVDTVIAADKRTRAVTGTFAGSDAGFAGYEIHAGVTRIDPGTPPLLRMEDGSHDGAVARDGRIAGCYVHGLFDRAAARAHLVAPLGVASDGLDRREVIDAALDGIAATLEASLAIDALIALAGTAA